MHKNYLYHDTSLPQSRWSVADIVAHYEQRIVDTHARIKDLKVELQNIRYKGRAKRANLRTQIQWEEARIRTCTEILQNEKLNKWPCIGNKNWPNMPLKH